MTLRRTLTAWAILIGVLAVTGGSWGLAFSSCCSASCESCPASFCKAGTADRSPRVDVLGPASSSHSRAVQVLTFSARVPVPLPVRIPRTDGFLRPMRN